MACTAWLCLRRLTMGAFEYFIVASPMGAAAAQAVCVNLGGNLASVHSEAENAMLYMTLVGLAYKGGATASPSGAARRRLAQAGLACGPDNTCEGKMCCSKSGFCGKGLDFCGEGCQGGPCKASSISSAPGKASKNASPDAPPSKQGASTQRILGWLGITVDRQGVASNLDGTKVDIRKWSTVGGDPNDYTTAAGGTSCVHFGIFDPYLNGGSWGDTECEVVPGKDTFHAGFPVCKRALRNTTACSSLGVDPGTRSPGVKKKEESDGVPLGVIVGAVIGCVVLVAVMLAVVLFLLKKKAATSGGGKPSKGTLPASSTSNYEPQFEDRPELNFGGKPPV